MPPPTAERATRAAPLPPDERRAAILRAVLPLLIEQGDRATSRQLAAAAEVSEGTIFKVFEDKDELLAAALEVALDPTPMSTAIEAIDRDLPWLDQLVAAVELIQQRVVDLWQLVSKLRAHHRHSRPPTPMFVSPALTALLAEQPDRLRIPAEQAATVLRGLTLSLSHPMLVADPRPPAEIVDLFLHGSGSHA